MSNVIKLLIECEILLENVGEIFLADKIKKVIKKKTLEGAEIKEILSWYGGMGSLNDLIISNDHVLNGGDEKQLNNRFNQLTGEIYENVFSLKNERNSNSQNDL